MISYDTVLYRGGRESCNKSLRITYTYSYNPATEKFATVHEKQNGNGVYIDPSYSLSISEGFEKPRIFIPGNKYFAFISLLNKAVDLVSENLFTLFPNVNKQEFESDSRALERFQTEKALAVCGITAMPIVWSDETGVCYPAIKFSSTIGNVSIPLEDAIQIKELLNHFDPICYSATMLTFFEKTRYHGDQYKQI